MDEHRVGLKPILRRVWSPRGHRPVVTVQPRYQWLYLYAFVQPATGQSFYLLLPSVSKAIFHLALCQFAAFVQAGDHKTVILLLDNAGWHRQLEQQQALPLGLELRYLPAYSPELQPAEHLWHLTDAPLVNRCFTSLDDLEHVLADRCRWLMTAPDIVRSATLFSWWTSPPHTLTVH